MVRRFNGLPVSQTIDYQLSTQSIGKLSDVTLESQHGTIISSFLLVPSKPLYTASESPMWHLQSYGTMVVLSIIGTWPMAWGFSNYWDVWNLIFLATLDYQFTQTYTRITQTYTRQPWIYTRVCLNAMLMEYWDIKKNKHVSVHVQSLWVFFSSFNYGDVRFIHTYGDPVPVINGDLECPQ